MSLVVGLATLAGLSGVAGASDSNMVPNPSVETADPDNAAQPQNWTPDSWGTNDASFSYSNTDAHSGSSSVEVQINTYTDGDAKWDFTPIAATPGAQYAFSDYYKASVQTEVDAVFNMSDGSIQYQIIGLPDATNGDWQQFNTTFSVPDGAQTMTVYHLIHAVGTLSTDDFTLIPYTPTGFMSPMVSLTFDDSLENQYQNALPLLQKYNLPATFFVISGTLGSDTTMTAAQVQQLAADGMEVGSHTVDHTPLSGLTASQYDSELGGSQATLQQILGGQAVTDFAYPEGLYNNAVSVDAQKYYGTTRGVEDGFNSRDNFNPYDLKVQNIFNYTTPAQVADWVAQAKQTNTWLILVYHGTYAPDDNTYESDDYGTSYANLDTELKTLASSGVPTKTINQAYTTIKTDINGDGTIDALDLSVVLTNWNRADATPAQGDINGDRAVDALDLSIVLTNWSK